jgi:7-carboxy-7-deazaguanine synthase
MKSGDHVKFTIASREDYIEALGLINKYDLTKLCRVIIGTAWKEFTEAELVELMLRDLPSGLVRLNVQIHKLVWDPIKRGV